MALKKENILIVDDNYDMLEVLQRNMKEQDLHTYRAASVLEAMDILKHSTIDLLITDLQMPGINGMELVKYVNEHFPYIPVLVITGFPSVGGAIEAVRSGAMDYLVKPFTKDELKNAVQKSLLQSQGKKPKTNVAVIPAKGGYAGITGQSEQIQQLIDIIERVKNNRATILIQGESGTGKELVARAIHYKGSFAANPFITVNCGAIPETLLESELFGYVKGAFTGANETRDGYFHAANTGTIFLDEIGTAPAAVQTSLLRVLQEKEIRRVGAQKQEKIELRIIAATNSDLFQMVQNGSFRGDLYYRLNVVNIETPPLRERVADILPLAENFLLKYNREYNKAVTLISEKAQQVLLRYPWPGNVRELENTIQRAVIMSDASIEIENLPPNLKYPKPMGKEELGPLKHMEKEYINKVLLAVGNNKTKAAEILQIDRKTLNQKIK